MGDRSDQFPVLQHRGTTHSLDNSTGSGEKIIIRDSQDKTFIGISCIAVDLGAGGEQEESNPVTENKKGRMES